MSILARFASRLPPVAEEFHCSLGEGSTPIVPSRAIGPALGLKNLFFKCEHQNPTGSYKDRFIALELSLLRQEGARLVFGTSSGNTGSSLAAFAARYELPCFLFVCERAPQGKLLQMRAHGAKVFRVRDFCISPETTSTVMESLRHEAAMRKMRPIISAFHFAPEGMKGVQTMSYEIIEQMAALGLQASHVFAPGGGCGLFLAIARGFLEDQNNSTRVHIVQPRLNDTVVTPLRAGHNGARKVSTTTAISGLAVPDVFDGHDAIAAARRTNGSGFLIEDEDALFWQRELLQKEGVWVEPAGAVSIAGVATAVQEGTLARDEPAVCVLTGHGFKDPVSTEATCPPENDLIEPQDVKRILAF